MKPNKKIKSTDTSELSKPQPQDYWDEEDPRGPSSSEINDYMKDLEEWERSNGI